MMKNNIAALALATLITLSACSSDDDNVVAGPLAEGTTMVMRNTLQEGGPEASYPSLFGAADDAFDETATLSFTDVEFPTALKQDGTAVGDIPGLYRVDFTADQISYTALPASDDPFWTGVADIFGIAPEGKFDRYYYTFSAPHNISAGTSSNPSVNLRIDSDTIVVVEIGAGFDFQTGVTFTIDLE